MGRECEHNLAVMNRFRSGSRGWGPFNDPLSGSPRSERAVARVPFCSVLIHLRLHVRNAQRAAGESALHIYNMQRVGILLQSASIGVQLGIVEENDTQKYAYHHEKNVWENSGPGLMSSHCISARFGYYN